MGKTIKRKKKEKKILLTKHKTDTKLLWPISATIVYRGWLEQHGPCYNTNTRLSFSSTRPSF